MGMASLALGVVPARGWNGFDARETRTRHQGARRFDSGQLHLHTTTTGDAVKYLPGADLSRLYDNRYPGTTWPEGPDVILFHTTETVGLPGYSYGANAPNATFGIKARKVWQHFSCNRSSRALVDAPGGAVTNRSRVFQIELICYSDRGIANRIGRPDLWVGNLTDDDLRWIAQQVAPLVKAYPIPYVLTPRFTTSPRYGTAAPQRMSAAEWTRFAGWTGHAYAPENSHWDPGALNIPKIMAYCKAITQDDDKDWFDMATEEDLRRIVREEMVKFANHGITVNHPDGERRKIELYQLLSRVYDKIVVPAQETEAPKA